MKAILKGKWFIFIAWIVAAVLLFITAPDMGKLVREKGQITVPEGYTSSEAQQILDEINRVFSKLHIVDITNNYVQISVICMVEIIDFSALKKPIFMTEVTHHSGF